MSVTSDALTRDGPTPVADPASETSTESGRDARSGGEPVSCWRRLYHSPGLRSAVFYLLLAGRMTDRFWRYMGRYQMADNGPDHIQFQYFLVWSARVVTHFEYPFFFTRMNFP